MYVVYETKSHTVKALKTHAHKHLLLFTTYLPICVLAEKKKSPNAHTHTTLSIIMYYLYIVRAALKTLQVVIVITANIM